MNLKFKGCKFLQYNINFKGCKKEVLGSGAVFWLRKAPYEGAPEMVQFCELRGRLNSPEACLTSTSHYVCPEYEQVTHEVDVEE